MAKPIARRYLLDNSYFDHGLRDAGVPHAPANLFGPFGKFKGYAWVSQPLEGYSNIVYISSPGKTRTVFNGLMDWMDQNKWKNIVFDKSIEVTPTHTKLYQSVIGQKYELQARIKQALVSISQSVADLELLEHDIRKYEEFDEYLKGMDTDVNHVRDKKEKKELERKKKFSEMAIKTVFVDQVDYHSGGTGQGPGRLSMAFMRNNNIMPTIVDDFMIMGGPDDLDNGPLKNLSTVEKNMLRIKWKAYQAWLSSFRNEVESRLGRLTQLRMSREKTLDEFREWVKPIISRELAIKEGFSEEGNRTFENIIGTEYSSLGEATAQTYNNILSFHRLSIEEVQKTPSEMYEMASEKISELDLKNIYDSMSEILVLDENVGLRVKYPWITKAWVDSVKGDCISRVKSLMLKGFSRYLIMSNIRYMTRNTIYRGEFEVEIGVYLIDTFMITPNIAVVKMIEQKAKDEEIKRYINQMLGLKDDRRTLTYTIKNGRYVVNKENVKKVVRDGGDEKSGFKNYDELIEKYPESRYKLRFTPEGENGTLKEIRNVFNFKFDFLNHLFPTHPGEYFSSDYGDYIYNKFRKMKGRGMFFSSTPYDKDFFDRVAQFHMVITGINNGKIRGKIQSLMGVPGI